MTNINVAVWQLSFDLSAGVKGETHPYVFESMCGVHPRTCCAGHRSSDGSPGRAKGCTGGSGVTTRYLGTNIATVTSAVSRWQRWRRW